MNHRDKEVFKIDLIKLQHCYIARSIVVELKLAEIQQQMRFQRSILSCYAIFAFFLEHAMSVPIIPLMQLMQNFSPFILQRTSQRNGSFKLKKVG